MSSKDPKRLGYWTEEGLRRVPRGPLTWAPFQDELGTRVGTVDGDVVAIIRPPERRRGDWIVRISDWIWYLPENRSGQSKLGVKESASMAFPTLLRAKSAVATALSLLPELNLTGKK